MYTIVLSPNCWWLYLVAHAIKRLVRHSETIDYNYLLCYNDYDCVMRQRIGKVTHDKAFGENLLICIHASHFLEC